MFTNKLDYLKVDFCQPSFSTEVIKQGWVVFFKNYMFLNQVRSLFPVPHLLIQERDFHSDTMLQRMGWVDQNAFPKKGWVERSRISPFPPLFSSFFYKRFLDGIFFFGWSFSDGGQCKGNDELGVSRKFDLLTHPCKVQKMHSIHSCELPIQATLSYVPVLKIYPPPKISSSLK